MLATPGEDGEPDEGEPAEGITDAAPEWGPASGIGSPLLSGELLPAEEPLHAPEQTLASLLQQCLRQDGHARHTVNGEST